MAHPDRQIARARDEWFRTPLGHYLDQRRKKLILDLLVPREEERLLDVGCGAGNHLLFLRRKCCEVTGIDSSPEMLDIARERLGLRADLYQGTPGDLPFSDNEFDIVTLLSFEQCTDPRKTLGEAIRVCRGRVFVGAWNRYSLSNLYKRTHHPAFSGSGSSSIFEINRTARKILVDVPITWGSVIFFPLAWYFHAAALEEKIPVTRNPFGAFIGATFPVVYTHITLQDPLKSPSELKVAKGREAPGAVRESHHD